MLKEHPARGKNFEGGGEASIKKEVTGAAQRPQKK